MIIRKLLLFFSLALIFLVGDKIYTDFINKSLNQKNLPLSVQHQLKIVTSFTILRDFAQKITQGVPNTQVISIVPPEADPHVYQPTPLDAKTLTEADVIFINGHDFEKGIEKMLKSTGTQARISIVAQNVTMRADLIDPHMWHNVQNAMLYVKEIAKVLSESDPENARLYQKNLELLLKELENLEFWIHQEVKKIPASHRIVVTTHDAFWYFGQAYDIKFLSPIGISTEAEASAQDVATLINFIREHSIKAVFVENLANPRLIEQIAKETNNSLHGTLYADSLSVPNGPAPDYISMIKHNVQTICKALLE